MFGGKEIQSVGVTQLMPTPPRVSIWAVSHNEVNVLLLFETTRV